MPLVVPSSFPLNRPTPFTYEFYRETDGWALICITVALMLYPLSMIQAYMYYVHYPGDYAILKILVGLISCLSTLHIGLVWHVLYHYTIDSYENPMILLEGTWTLYATGLVSMAVYCIVQTFYIRVIYQLTKGKRLLQLVLTSILVGLNLMQLAIALMAGIEEMKEGAVLELTRLIYKLWIPLAVTRASADIVIALSLTVLLHQTRPLSGQAGRLVHTLIVMAISRFLLTTAIVIVAMIALIRNPTAVWPASLDLIFLHLYVNSCLATLNLRSRLRSISEGTRYLADTVTGIRFASD